jgi:hypothetical protein
MTDEVDEMSAASRGAAVMAYAVIDDEGVQHSLWFLEKDATSEAAMVGGTVVRLGHPTLTEAEREAIGRDLDWLKWCEDNRQIGDVGRKDIATLRGLLERLG